MIINAQNADFAELNQAIRNANEDCKLTGCLGQRFIAAGATEKTIEIEGIPGNALGAYLSGARITVYGNGQDAVGDTMNSGEIILHGNVGDAVGYSMRDGAIYVKGNAGYRAGVHMKAYREKQPTLVIGGHTGSFLGEYQAGGLILVLGLHTDGKPITGNFPCTGMHGGKVVLRGDFSNIQFPDQTRLHPATQEDLSEIRPALERFCSLFGYDPQKLLQDPYTVITPDSSNPYRQLYIAN